MRIGSPLFHFGILGVFLGHVVGLGIPESWTEAVGVSEGVYHFLAVSLGAVAGAAAVIGMLILITAGAPSARCSAPPRAWTR